MSNVDVDTGTVRVERTFEAPAEAVFDAWTNPEVLRRWWKANPAARMPTPRSTCASAAATASRCTTRRRRGPLVVHGTYREISRPDRLVYSWTWEGTGPYAGHESEVAVTFQEDAPGRTTVVIEHAGLLDDDLARQPRQRLDGVLESFAGSGIPARADRISTDQPTQQEEPPWRSTCWLTPAETWQRPTRSARPRWPPGAPSSAASATSLVDAGNPFGPSTTVGSGSGTALTGYSIITAGSLDEAAEKAKAAPVVGNGGGVAVYETLEVDVTSPAGGRLRSP